MNKQELIDRVKSQIKIIDMQNQRTREGDNLGYVLKNCLPHLQSDEWFSGIPITSGVYWCEIEKDGKRFTKALHYGNYSYCPSCDLDSKDIDEMLEPWESRIEEDDDSEIVGTGWFEEPEQFGWEYDYALIAYGGRRGKILQYTNLPTPPGDKQ